MILKDDVSNKSCISLFFLEFSEAFVFVYIWLQFFVAFDPLEIKRQLAFMLLLFLHLWKLSFEIQGLCLMGIVLFFQQLLNLEWIFFQPCRFGFQLVAMFALIFFFSKIVIVNYLRLLHKALPWRLLYFLLHEMRIIIVTFRKEVKISACFMQGRFLALILVDDHIFRKDKCLFALELQIR